MNGKTTLSCWRTFFPTSYHATELAAVSPGKTVAVFGAGPVGLLAAYSALLKGAAEVYVVDNVAERLEKAKELGATCRFQPGRSSRADFRNSSKTSWNSAEPSSRRRKAAGCGLVLSMQLATKPGTIKIRHERIPRKHWKMPFGW